MGRAEEVAPGTTWRSNKGLYTHGDVLVVRVSDTGRVVARRKDGKTWQIPLAGFLSSYERQGGESHDCQRCGSTSLRLTDKYCKECQAAIARFRRAGGKPREEDQNGPVITTSSPKLIEQRKQEEAHNVAVVPQEDKRRALKWRIRVRVVVDVEVEGATVIDALGAAEAEYPGMEVTDVHLLD